MRAIDVADGPYYARIVCDSVSPAGHRLTTFEVRFPRFILAEVNTHKMISKSSASSRAIPVEKRIKMVQNEPFVPEAFGKNKRGMQSTEALEGEAAEVARLAWRGASVEAVRHASVLADLGVHKQYANRLLEPFSWHTAVLTGTDWSNFFALRCHPDAQPEFQRTARLMRDALAKSEPVPTRGWHLPYVRGVDEAELLETLAPIEEKLPRVSAARSGRVSYLTQDGRRDVAEDLALYERYVGAFHMSPLEHCARPYDPATDEAVALKRLGDGAIYVGNLRGWTSLRKTIPGEHDFSLRGT